MPELPDNNINNSLNKLIDWLENNGWAGYDPYDIKAHPKIIRLIQKSQDSRIYTLLREIFFEFFYMLPVVSRKIFGIVPAINPKAIGLLSDAFLNLYKNTHNTIFFQRAEAYLNWLRNNASDTSEGLGWGYPFDWQSTAFIPAGTPNGIVTTAIGEAFWKKYSLNKNPEDLDILIKIGHFLAGLPKDRITNTKICFSYTPLFQNHVHNLNLFIAEFLLKVGMETNNTGWIELAGTAINYTISDQNPDGSFDYNGPPEPPANFIDHYHTGFVLRTLFSIWKLTGRGDVYDAIIKGYKFYEKYFFKDDVIPKLKPDRTYRIDIHSCAEAVNCLCILSALFPEARDKAEKVLLWTIRELQDKKGYFYYGILKSRFTGIRYKSKIPYFRWNQAWMMKAFATYFITLPAK